MTGLAARDVSFVVEGRYLVRQASLDLAAGEVMGIIGPNGAGKSTLVKLLAGDLDPNEGTIELDGRALGNISPGERAQLRAVLPQVNLLRFPFAVREVVLMGRHPHRRSPGNTHAHDVEVATDMMVRTDTADVATRLYPTLSSGEQTRVSLARVLAQETPIVLLDEPAASLDVRYQEQVMGVLRNLAAEGAAVLAVMHDLNLAARYADRVGLMDAGGLAALGPTREVLTDDLLSRVYGQAMVVVDHPHRDCPLVLVVDE